MSRMATNEYMGAKRKAHARRGVRDDEPLAEVQGCPGAHLARGGKASYTSATWPTRQPPQSQRETPNENVRTDAATLRKIFRNSPRPTAIHALFSKLWNQPDINNISPHSSRHSHDIIIIRRNHSSRDFRLSKSCKWPFLPPRFRRASAFHNTCQRKPVDDPIVSGNKCQKKMQGAYTESADEKNADCFAESRVNPTQSFLSSNSRLNFLAFENTIPS